jgi:hypothetical protein
MRQKVPGFRLLEGYVYVGDDGSTRVFRLWGSARHRKLNKGLRHKELLRRSGGFHGHSINHIYPPHQYYLIST